MSEQEEKLLADPPKTEPAGDDKSLPPYHVDQEQPQHVVYRQPPANTVRHILTSLILPFIHSRKEQGVIH